jgi:hypothetical protein
MFALHADDLACFFTRLSAGIRIASNNAMIAITTSNSINVKPVRFRFLAQVVAAFDRFAFFELYINYLQLLPITVPIILLVGTSDAHRRFHVLLKSDFTKDLSYTKSGLLAIKKTKQPFFFEATGFNSICIVLIPGFLPRQKGEDGRPACWVRAFWLREAQNCLKGRPAGFCLTSSRDFWYK